MIVSSRRRIVVVCCGLALLAFLASRSFANHSQQADVRRRDQEHREQHHVSSRNLQFGSNLFASILGFIIPFYQPNQYTLQPVEAFEVSALCTSLNALDQCNNLNTLRFTSAENPERYEFRYHNFGPEQLQGAFWTIQEQLDNLFAFTDDITFASSDLVSFARTRHGNGVQTGVLQTDENGYDYVQRPLGDHNWSASSNSPDTFLTGLDVLYLYKLVEGTLENPLAFTITPSFKFLSPCFRFNFGTAFGVLAKFDMVLVTDPNDPAQLEYPGSKVWKRTTTFLNLFKVEYLSVQIVNGLGQPIQPAFSKFQQSIPVTLVTGLRDDMVDAVQNC